MLARGGGSFEDLLPFSDERLVRAVAACPVPVVSAVGHEQDTPLCDLAADARASTPTAAARLVVPDCDELLAAARAHARRPCARRARRRSSAGAQRLVHAHERLRRAPALAVERKRHALEHAAGRLRALSPRATLERGYAIVRSRRRDRPLDDAVAAGDAGRRRGRRRPLRSTRRVSAEPTFEEAQRELEQIVERLERGEAGLDEAIELWERGEELYKLCVGKLDAAQGKIEELARRVETAKP